MYFSISNRRFRNTKRISIDRLFSDYSYITGFRRQRGLSLAENRFYKDTVKLEGVAHFGPMYLRTELRFFVQSILPSFNVIRISGEESRSVVPESYDS